VPNPLRILPPDAIVHAGSRGSNRGLICWDEQDYASMVGEIARAAAREAWRVLAWCVMPNHYHLVIRMTRGGFSTGFQQINGNHARRTNRRYGRDAHLWKNRPWHELVQTWGHLVGSIEYVVRNPIDGDLCQFAHEWPYSSYRATMGLEEAPAWLAVDEVLGLYGTTPSEARARFAARVHTGQVPASDAA
jgi:REP-associated tyrosine transposase